ncbi:MAG: class I SAM-dependent methyltransferase [Candidatus Obscuribacterales bacterium]|nr:class I SAM-dependent methyltransferase [Candidatus Obscuribacterales bacterium]
MYDPTRYNPTERFTGLSALYTAGRPSYPGQAIEHIIAVGRLDESRTLADIGCGTGISSRQFADRGIRVIGVDPNQDMLEEAKAASRASVEFLQYRQGSAEATGLEDESCDVVLCAQAFHWFNAEKALTEFHRILRSGGAVALMWNERDEQDPFTASYGNLLRARADASSIEVQRGEAGIALLQCSLFEQSDLAYFRNEQDLNEETLMARAFSTSYAPPLATKSGAQLASELKDLLKTKGTDGTAIMRYQCSVYTAHKR